MLGWTSSGGDSCSGGWLSVGLAVDSASATATASTHLTSGPRGRFRTGSSTHSTSSGGRACSTAANWAASCPPTTGSASSTGYGLVVRDESRSPRVATDLTGGSRHDLRALGLSCSRRRLVPWQRVRDRLTFEAARDLLRG